MECSLSRTECFSYIAYIPKVNYVKHVLYPKLYFSYLLLSGNWLERTYQRRRMMRTITSKLNILLLFMKVTIGARLEHANKLYEMQFSDETHICKMLIRVFISKDKDIAETKILFEGHCQQG